MGIDIIFKIGAIGILITVVAQVLTKAGRDEIAMLATLAGLVVVLVMVIDVVAELFNSIRAVFYLQ